MGNILNHNRKLIDFDLLKDEYWDFHLCSDDTYSNNEISDGLAERCLSAYIDLSDDECIWFDNIYGKRDYTWEHAINDGTLVFNSFGFTSVDNGKTHYEKDRISNKEFFEIFTNTRFGIEKDELRLVLSKVNGNHQIYDYSNDIAFWNDQIQAAKLNGGWYQGFFCADEGQNYKILPTDIGNGWDFEFVLNKEDFTNERQTLNSIYSENKGIFFYIGTRAENKWWEKYLTQHDFDWCKKSGFADDYAEEDYLDADLLNIDYFLDVPEEENKTNISNNDETPIETEYVEYPSCDMCKYYVNDEYYEKDVVIDENMKLETEGGYDMYQPNIEEVDSDNKFLIFDRTKEGETVKTWDENTKFILNYIKKPNVGNYFKLFHRSCGGYDVKKIQELLEVKNKDYNVLEDIYRNALAFQIKDDGTIGYKFLVKDCESEEEKYKIESEFTKNPIIYNKVWYTINVRIIPLIHKDKSLLRCLSENGINDKMQIYIYVNGKLVLVSKELPILNLKKLNDLNDKQQGVPFNISIGGGTQGLAEVVFLNYMKTPKYILPLEKEFGGSFVGWLKSFRFYTCPLNYTEILNNYLFIQKQ